MDGRQMDGKRENAYLTVYLALTMAVLLSLCLALIEGARGNAVYLEVECVTDICLNSLLAEYHRELLKQYDLFAIDDSYGTAQASVANTQRRLTRYLERNLSQEDVLLDGLIYKDFLGLSLEGAKMTKVSILTDERGAVFRRRAAEAAWDDLGLNLYQELMGWMEVVETNELTERDIPAEKRALDEELESYNGREIEVAGETWGTVNGQWVKIEEAQWETIEVENPTEALESKRREGILKQVVDHPEELSSRTLPMDNLIEARMAAGQVNQGNNSLPVLSGQEQLLERFFFQEYLLRHMGSYRNPSEEDALLYQAEYLIAGRENDLDNLRSVANTLCAVREAANTVYLFTDEEKKGAAETAGTVLASAMMIPEAAELIGVLLLFGWAYAESVYDVKCLMAGGRVPLMKNSATWHYDLDGALNFGGEECAEQGTGLSYEDYMRILLLLKDEDILTARAMNMVEADIRRTAGNENFRLDGCLDSVEACIDIKSGFGYSCEITRQKGYSTQ